MVSRVCEEFGCLPDVAESALEDDLGLIPTILTLRAFARTKEVYDNSEDYLNLPQSRMMDLLQDIEFEHVDNPVEIDGN